MSTFYSDMFTKYIMVMYAHVFVPVPDWPPIPTVGKQIIVLASNNAGAAWSLVSVLAVAAAINEDLANCNLLVLKYARSSSHW